MSKLLTPEEIETDKAYGVLIDDGATFNLPMLQVFLGGLKADSAKKWAKLHGLVGVPGRTWVFSGKMLREAIERSINQGVMNASE